MWTLTKPDVCIQMNKTSRSRSVSLFASVFGIAVAVVWIPVATNVPAVLASQDSLDEKSVDSIPSVGQSSPRLLQSVAQCKQSVMLGIPMDGILSTINVKEGDRVRQGQILARMDSQIAKANVEMARIESERTGPIRRAEASLMSTSRKLEEICRVFLQGGASPNEQREACQDLPRCIYTYEQQMDVNICSRHLRDLTMIYPMTKG